MKTCFMSIQLNCFPIQNYLKQPNKSQKLFHHNILTHEFVNALLVLDLN